MFEAVGSYAAGTMTEEDVYDFDFGACRPRFLLRYVHRKQHELPDRVLGMGLKGNGTIPAVYSGTSAPAKSRYAGYGAVKTGISVQETS